MVDGRIRFSTDILSRLGEELNPNVDQGVLELVKNAFDADATSCEVLLSGVTSVGGSVVVSDNGDGMSRDDVADGWLVLGSSKKETSQRTLLGRIPAGNKGLGRLAALRLGTHALVESQAKGQDSEVKATLDWSKYDDASIVDEVPVPIEELSYRGAPHGTKITISGLRSKVGRAEVKRLARAMILLADPFGDHDLGFVPVLKAPEFVDLENLVAARYFDDADYHLTARIAKGRVSAEIRDWRGETLWTAAHDEISVKDPERLYVTPDATFDLWAFNLNPKTFSGRAAGLPQVREWLGQFGGVHLYMNGLRVTPYGNPGNDWLDLNLRRVQSPEERPSTNNSIGRVSVPESADLLVQKTDRSGFIETEAFEDLRRFASDSLEWMARVRLVAAESRRQKSRTESVEKSKKSRESVEEQIDKVPGPSKESLASAFAKYSADRDREADVLRREVQLYRTLSTAGITAATFAHESNGNPLKVIGQSINAIERRAKKVFGDDYESALAKPVDGIRRSAASLNVLAAATLRLIDQDKRRAGKVMLHTVTRQIVETFMPFLEGRKVEMQLSLSEGDPYLMGTEAAVESIVTNLINNSLAAFENAHTEARVLRIESEVIERQWRLLVLDNGPGIQGIATTDIWLPGRSERPGGTGLGLTIVRDATSDLSGTASAVSNGALGGATFTIELPILGVERDH